jgi:hypothetical protein
MLDYLEGRVGWNCVDLDYMEGRVGWNCWIWTTWRGEFAENVHLVYLEG